MLEKDVEKFQKIYSERKENFEIMHSRNIPDSKKILSDLRLKWDIMKIADKREIIKIFIDHASLNDNLITIFMK